MTKGRLEQGVALVKALDAPVTAREHATGCTCSYGCPTCGEPESRMGDCPRFGGCKVGREPDPACPIHNDSPEDR